MTDQSKPKVKATQNPAKVAADEAERIRLQRAADETRPEVRFISEGVRAEIEQRGEALDPITGRTLTKDDLK